MGVASRYTRGAAPPPVSPPDASQRLAEALLGADMCKTPRALLIRFDEPRDSNIVHKTLVGLRDAYVPPRK
jgi:hypothetical protein